MNSGDSKLGQLRLLISEAIEDVITDDRMQLLNQILTEDPAARKYYLEYINLLTIMKNLFTHEADIELDNLSVSQDLHDFDNVLKQLAEDEKNALPLAIDPLKQKPQEEINDKIEYKKPIRKTRKASLFVAIFSAAALFFLIVYAQIAPGPTTQEVATVIELVGAEWASESASVHQGERLCTSRGPLTLTDGVAQLSLDSGVIVTLEGPVKFEFVSPMEVGLHYGRFYADVSETGKGFTVATVNSRIIDLGTEFGIDAAMDGSTELHVFKGKTTLVAGTQKANKQVVDVVAGQAKRIQYTHSQINAIHLKETYFAKGINSDSKLIWRGESFSLASLVAGGNGFDTQTALSGIDPLTGNIHQHAVQEWDRLGTEDFHPVSERPGVDGVFVPNGGRDANVVSSAGHRFDGFPETDSYYWADITTDPHFIDATDSEKHTERVILKTVQSSNSQEPAFLLIHPNAGITFDLEKIRQSLPKIDITRFKATCGLPKDLQERRKSEFWVLIDGACVFHYSFDGSDMDPKKIDLPIKPEQRFLTLVTTDGGDEIIYDWCVFADPELVLY